MRLTCTREAMEELAHAVKHCRAPGDGLGGAFFQRIEAAGEEIITWPEAWRSVGGPYRRRRLKRFPCGLIHHQPEPGWLEVAAVMHLHRGPDYWRGGVE
ncbi:MAG: plasmid stabilization protein [Verrucomicrobiales bacterium]|nr:plasmid stabilization protein [Verrucomicrobiales bacterium]